ncbi:MAG: hypothetical protein ACJ8BF_14440 [Gemmatimonadales bacterium]
MSGAPVWWDADGNSIIPEIVHPAGCTGAGCQPAEIVSLSDPRWARASSSSRDPQYVDFRALFRGGNLYLSWQVLLDPDLTPPTTDHEDALWFGIKQKSGKPAFIVKLTLNTVATATQNAYPRPNDGVVYYEVAALQNTGTTAANSNWLPFTLPGSNWVKEKTRVWTRWPGGPGTTASWTFQTVVPKNALGLSSGLDFDDTFEMWYVYVVDMGAAGVAQYQDPDRGVVIGTTGANLPNPWISTDWHQFSLGIPPPGMTCAGDVSLTSMQIGTTNPIASKILFTPPGNPDARSLSSISNTFFARPTNERPSGSASIGTGAISARFYLANWGTQANWNDLGSGTTIETLWRDITPGPAPSNAAPIPPGPATAAQGVQFLWPPIPDCDRYDYLPDPYPNGLSPCPVGTKRRAHQCMLVELFSTTASLTFVNKSIYRNMDIVPASTFTRAADVSVVGLTPVPDGRTQRDVYLFVETINMPAQSGQQEAGKLRAQQRGSPQTSAQLDSVMPTYRIYAWHTTGDSVTMGGIKRPIVRAQNSFGYWVDHSGKLQGWRHRLEGANLTRLGPNLYRIAVSNNGVATIRTTIEALEPRLFALSLHAGVSLPHGSLNTNFDPGSAVTIDATYRLSSTFAIAGLFGFHRFSGAGSSGHLNLYHLSGSLQRFLISGPTAVFIEAGGGIYLLDPGPTKPGIHAGAGLEFEVSPRVLLGPSYRLHNVFTTGANTTFSSVQAGGRILF